MAHREAACQQSGLEFEHRQYLMLLAYILGKYLFPAWLDQCRVTRHQVRSGMGKWDTKHPVDLHAQVDVRCA